MGFSTEGSDDLFWLMQSADANANRAILTLIEDHAWREDLPRLVRGSLGRQRQAHWDTTLANAWGVLAMERFRRAFEAEPIAGVTSTGARCTSGIGLVAEVARRLARPPLADRAPAARHRTPRHRPPLGHGPEPRRDPLEGAALERLPHHPHRDPHRAPGVRSVEPRRCPARHPRARGPSGHDLGRGERSHPRRRHDPRHRSRPRFPGHEHG